MARKTSYFMTPSHSHFQNGDTPHSRKNSVPSSDSSRNGIVISEECEKRQYEQITDLCWAFKIARVVEQFRAYTHVGLKSLTPQTSNGSLSLGLAMLLLTQ